MTGTDADRTDAGAATAELRSALPSAAGRLRVATEADLAAIMALETSVFVTDAWSTDLMRAELVSPHSYYLVAEREGAIVAYSGLRAVQGAADADIQTIAVAPQARRLGVGRALMRAMLAEAARRGGSDVFLEVRADNPPAQTLYRDLGFEQIAVRPRYYQPDDVDALVMRLTLRSEPNR
ncbi:ribosomal protein S18-alanine N-acetyltransferase [Humibacter albus]|uniref:ribosomal protein S18-alanine N-acetyltransferase n=1 Tax=Humibacter albus TaxID=427754 RepID=UPI0004279E0A